MTAQDKKKEYERQYSEKTEQIRKILHRANITGDSTVGELQQLDVEVGKLRATIDALDQIVELQEASGQMPDRRYQDNILNAMIATVQTTSGELNEVKHWITDVKTDVKHLTEDHRIFERLVSDSIRSFQYSTATTITTLRRTVIVIGFVVVLWFVVDLLMKRGVL